MSSFKCLIVLCFVLINLQIILADPCESFNCTRCVEIMSKNEPDTDLDTLKEYCAENGDKMAEESSELFTGYDVQMRVYNLSEKIGEMYGNDNPQSEDNLHKSIVVHNQEFNLLPSMSMITQNDPNSSPLGKPVQLIELGRTKLTESQFIEYLRNLNLDEFKDETFDDHMNEIITYLLTH